MIINNWCIGLDEDQAGIEHLRPRESVPLVEGTRAGVSTARPPAIRDPG